MIGTILLVGLVLVLAVLGVEYGLYRRAKKREAEGMFDHALPFIDGHHLGDGHGDAHAHADDIGAMDHIDPSDHPGV